MESKKTSRTKKKTSLEVIRENQMEQLKERVHSIEKEIEELETSRRTLVLTHVVGLTVMHKLFGRGMITAQNGVYITVKFDSAEKNFVLPNAFIGDFLTTETVAVNENFSLYQQIGEKISQAKKEMESTTRAIQILKKDKVST